MTIQHVPPRAHLLPRLFSALGPDWLYLTAIIGDPELRNPWTTYRECLRIGSAESVGASHLLVIQDDALPVERFHERLAPLVAERPGELLCLYVPALPAYMGREMHRAHLAGLAFTTIPGGMFTPLVAAVWPVWLAEDCLAWSDKTPSSTSRRCDDAQVARFLRTKRLRPTAVVPSLVEHDEQTPSTIGLGRYKRSAAILG